MEEEDRINLDNAVAILNRHGREAAAYLKEQLEKPENEEAAGWVQIDA